MWTKERTRPEQIYNVEGHSKGINNFTKARKKKVEAQMRTQVPLVAQSKIKDENLSIQIQRTLLISVVVQLFSPSMIQIAKK